MKTLILCFCLSLFWVGDAASNEKKTNAEAFLYGGFKKIKNFSSVNVYLRGSAKEVGLNDQELTDYLRLRFKNSFGNVAFKEKNIKEISKVSIAKRKEMGFISVVVWTVGDDFPIAYHVEISSGNYSDFEVYRNAALGYGAKSNVIKSIKDTIDELTDSLAISFFKARNEL